MDTANIKINSKILEEWQLKMLTDKKFPMYNDGVLFVVALDMLKERWEIIKDQTSPDRFEKFYGEMMHRVKKLQKEGYLNADLKKMRTLEEVQNAN